MKMAQKNLPEDNPISIRAIVYVSEMVIAVIISLLLKIYRKLNCLNFI